MSQLILKLALNNVLSAIQKLDDAPLSAGTHLNTAVVQLLLLCNSFHADGDDAEDIIRAIGENLWLVQLELNETREWFKARPDPRDETISELKKDLDRKHRECAERERQCALQAEYIAELEAKVEADKTVKDYALWQAITDLEMFCRHRSAGQLQIESEDKQSTPIIENALILLKALKVDIEQNPHFPNIKINYNRDDNPFFGKSGK